MDIELLKTFLEVSRTRHFGRAAENLYLTQSAVSARVRQLEQALGTPLFLRTRNNIQLTQAGERFRPHAEAALTAWERGRQSVALRDEKVTELALAAPPSLWDSGGQRALVELRARLPDLALNVDMATEGVLIRHLLEDRLDLALCYDAPKRYDLVIRPVFPLQLVLVASKPDQNVGQVQGEPYILVDWGTSFTTQHAEAFAEMAPPGMRTGSGRIALDTLLAADGAAYLPEPVVAPYLEKGALHPVAQAPVFERQVHLAYKKQHPLANLVDRVADIVLETPWEVSPSIQP
ncbi:LysR substrate-binding domain-containing protein [Marinobacteraceae bacterium S3BR75-40.1]